MSKTRAKAPAITRPWKRLLAFGCSHGSAVRRDAVDAILAMRRAWKPDMTIHLGDFADTAAFRSGARGTADECAPIAPDIDAGLSLLDELGCTLVFAGNHEDRIARLTDHPNAIIADCAQHTWGTISDRIRAMGAVFVPAWPSWRILGGVRFGHGTMFNEQYLRDTAESYGPSVVAHGHRAGVATGRRIDSPLCLGVGTLTDRASDDMGYAKARRSTLAWSGGFVWGEVCGDAAQLWLHDNGQSQVWRLPV